MTKEELVIEISNIVDWGCKEGWTTQEIIDKQVEHLLTSYHIIPKSVKCYEGTLLTGGGGDDILVPAFGDLKNDGIDLYFLGQDNEGKYIRLFIEEEKCD